MIGKVKAILGRKLSCSSKPQVLRPFYIPSMCSRNLHMSQTLSGNIKENAREIQSRSACAPFASCHDHIELSSHRILRVSSHPSLLTYIQTKVIHSCILYPYLRFGRLVEQCHFAILCRSLGVFHLLLISEEHSSICELK